MTDTLLQCPKCKQEECCSIIEINEWHNAYNCIACGFQTTDLMREGEFDFEEYESPLDFPELYKDIKYTDEESRVWYPTVVNVLGKGTVFAAGSTKDDWEWNAIKSVELTDEEKQLSKYKGQTYKSDSSTLQKFGFDFFAACDFIGIFEL